MMKTLQFCCTLKRSPLWPSACLSHKLWPASVLLASLLLTVVMIPSSAIAEENRPSGEKAKPKYATFTIRGRVVWLGEALARRFQVKTVPEAEQRVLALETPQGELFPLVEDIRGRSFRLDQRLREMDLELMVRRYEGSPMVQVVLVHALRDGNKYEVDYWCEICAIAMYELKPCDCCQAPIELRFQRVKEKKP